MPSSNPKPAEPRRSLKERAASLKAAASKRARGKTKVTETAGAVSLDAELIEAGRRWEAAISAYRDACKREDDTAAATVRPSLPPDLLMQEQDDGLGLARYACQRGVDDLWWYSVGEEGHDASASILLRIICRLPAAQRRARQIVEAFDAYMATSDAAEEASGFSEARAELDRASLDLQEAEARVERLRACTVDGLKAKARIIMDDKSRQLESTDALVHGLAADVLAMAAVEAKDVPQGSGLDPVLAVIAAHRAAHRAWEPHLNEISETPHGSPDFAKVEAAGEPARVKEEGTFAALFEAWPSSLPGLLALADYLPHAVMRNGCSQPTDDGIKALDALCFALKRLVRDGRVMADRCELPAPKPAPDAPADLAEACDWAVRHVDWFNTGEGREGQTDEQDEAEYEKSAAVWSRALAEPVRDLRTLAAVARMLRHDWLQHYPTDEESGDGARRLMLKIMREVSALAGSEQGSDLAARMTTFWPEYEAMSDDATSTESPAYKRRWDLLEEAEALPATASNIYAKGIALAWITCSWRNRPGVPPSELEIDARLALSIAAALSSEQRFPSAPAEFGGLPDPGTTTARLPVEALTARELLYLDSVASTFADLGNAVLCQPRCGSQQQGLYVTRNAAGNLTEWIVEVSHVVMERVRERARQLRPIEEDEADDRLSILAYPSTTGGAPHDMRTFARDLEVQAQRIEARG